MDLQVINKRLISGFLSLTFSQAVLLAINFITINIILARILPVGVIGIFNIGNTILSIFTFFSDVGLAASLIQKKDISQDDLKSTFFIQEILAILITTILWFSASLFAHFFNLNQEGMWLIRALAISFLLTSFKVIPSVLLERQLKFVPLVMVNIAETVFYNGALIVLSNLDFGLGAFSWAAIARSLVGLAAIYSLAPWKPGISFSKSSLKGLLQFGLPFQVNNILALIKDRLVPLIIASIIGPIGVGFVTWSQNLALLPVLLVSNLIRLTFPTFSRLQDQKPLLKHFLERAVFLTSFFSFPLIFGLLSITPSLIEHIVTDKWKPALPLIYLFSINTFWATISTTFTNFLNAIGKIKTTLKLMIMWTLLTWILSPVLALFYGFIGVGVASAIISFTSIFAIIITQREVKINLIANTYQPFLASIATSLITFIVASELARDYLTTILTVILAGFIYLLLVLVFFPGKLILAIKGVQNVDG